MADRHNTSFFPQGAAPCIFLMPLENIVTPQLSCKRGRENPSRTPKYGNTRASTGTCWTNPFFALRMPSELVRRAQFTTVMDSHLGAAEPKSAYPSTQSWMMTASTKLHRRKMYDRVILSFTLMQGARSHIQDSWCGEIK